MCFVCRAYETLGNQEKRSIYDATGMSSNDQQNTDFNFDGFESFGQMFKGAFSKAKAKNESQFRTYEEILEEYEKFFSMEEELSKEKSRNLNQSIRGTNIVFNLNLSFAESLVGVSKIIKFDQNIKCPVCEGRRVKPAEDQAVCSSCSGSGTMKSDELC